jgi:hypothetical protein
MNPREGAYVLAADATCGFEVDFEVPLSFP